MADEFGHMDDGLLVKYLIGETDGEENLLVEKWLEASDENREEYARVQKVWQGSLAVSKSKVDTDAAWAKLSGRIDEFEETAVKAPVVRTLNRPKWNWAAASVLLALVGLFGVFQYITGKEVKVSSDKLVVEQTLPDGSSVALNGNSELEYAKNFDGDLRKVKLKGEAFFEVQPNAEKPFVIDGGLGEVKVLGTSFNVEAKEGSDIRVHVVTGRVQLSLPGAIADTSLVILEIGETGIIDHKTKRVYKESPLYEDALFWLNKKLVFNKLPLPRVFEVLEKNYNLSFSAYDKSVEKCLLTARFEKESIESILEVISATFNIQFTVDGETVQINAQDHNCAED